MANLDKSKMSKKEVKSFKHGDVIDIDINLIYPNDWNPNEMSMEEFNLLAENIEEVDFLDPLLVSPVKQPDDSWRFLILDGEHRWEVMRLKDAKKVKCIIATSDKIAEDDQKFQTVRMNKIRGRFNRKKFNNLVQALADGGKYTYDELAYKMGFTDNEEFEKLLDTARESLPSEEMKEAFDKARDEIKTVDDLSLVLNRLFTKFGDTLPANFMVLDFGGKEHIWVRLKRKEQKDFLKRARLCLEEGVTFDSVLVKILSGIDFSSFIKEHRGELDETNSNMSEDGLI